MIRLQPQPPDHLDRHTASILEPEVPAGGELFLTLPVFDGYTIGSECAAARGTCGQACPEVGVNGHDCGV
jgi:hypothetical protein